MKKTLGILGLLVAICTLTALLNPQFLSPYNLENLVERTGLYGILGIGVAFVIIGGGIDLSIGSVVGLAGSLLPWLLANAGLSPVAAVVVVLGLCLLIGLAHGLLVTRLHLQPFVVTLCGLLLYRGFARYLTDDQTQGFGDSYDTLRLLSTGKPCSAAFLAMVLCSISLLALLFRRTPDGRALWQSGRARQMVPLLCAAGVVLGAGDCLLGTSMFLGVQVPMPFLIMAALALLAGTLLQRTVYGRHLLAIGRNEQAARYSGIRTDRVLVMSYVFCSMLAGLGGILFALDVNSVQPSMMGNFYELYAIAAAVLGGCSLRGGEGTIFGVVVGAAVMRVLYNSINLLGIPTQLEFAIIGAVILIGVIADELVKRMVARRRPG